MIALGRRFVICALAALLAGCDGIPAVFEDVGDDPHPPEFTLLGIAIQPPGNPLPLPDFLPPGTTVTVRPFDEAEATNRIALLADFRDDGGDLDVIAIRDLDGSLDVAIEVEDFRTSGRLWIVTDAFPVGVEGVHRLEVWAEDTKDSRSGKTPFTVNVQLF